MSRSLHQRFQLTTIPSLTSSPGTPDTCPVLQEATTCRLTGASLTSGAAMKENKYSYGNVLITTRVMLLRRESI
ncbi:hypothetical protein LSAT2_012747 [Lamellibrachia satsuma]|nr:hypothetical protein LSAT2_012747 [Lamellibrachia satsuma]